MIEQTKNKIDKIILSEEGFISDKVPTAMFDELLEALDIENNILKPRYSSMLAGNIEEQYGVSDILPESFKDYLKLLANEYYNMFPMHRFKEEMNFKIESSWLNIQKKHEFNPLHKHSADLSYVLWIKIPYKLENEFAVPNCESAANKLNSLFTFFTSQQKMVPLYIDQEHTGNIIMFQSSLHHQVFPFFSSDDYRISLAGNLIVD